MANLTCLNLLNVDHIRVLRLNAAGNIVASAQARYEYDAPLLMSYTSVQPDRDTAEQRSGNGNICATYTGPSKPPSQADLTLNLCQLDAELLELLVGGTTITTGTGGGGDTIGWLAPTDETVNEAGVALEVWSKAWSQNQRAVYNAEAAWFRHFFPKCTFQQGEQSMSNDGFSTIPLTGVSTPNSQFGTGWEDDPLPVAIGNSPWGWVLDDSIPDAECGYLPVAA